MSDRVVAKFYLLQVTRSVGFISPVFTLFLLRDLSFTQVGALSALSAALVVAGEVPTGYVGDRLGRRTSIGLSVTLKALSLAGFVFVRSFWAYAVLYVPWAVGMTFASGSLDAWLYDTLDERLDADAFTRVRGRAEAVMRWTSVATALAGGVLYTLAPTWPFVASVGLNALGLGVLATLPRNRAYRDDAGTEAGEGDADATGGARAGEGRVERDGDDAAGRGEDGADSDALAVLRRAAGDPSLRGFALYVGLFFAVVSAAATYVQPMTETMVETALPTGLPVGVLLGVLYAAFTGVSAVASQWAGAVEDRLGTRRVLVAVPVATAVLFVLPRVALLAALPMFVALRASRSLLLPMVNGHVAGAVDDAGRATAVSAVSMLVRLYKLPLAVGAGVLADATGATTAVAALGGLFLAAAGLATLLGSPLASVSGRGDRATAAGD